MLKTALTLAALVLVALAGSPRAFAVSSHERVEMKPIKKGGEVVGVAIHLTLRPDGNSAQKTVRVVLGKQGMNLGPANYTTAATQKSFGYLAHEFDDIPLDGSKNPKEVTLKVLYKDAPGLTPGDAVDVTTVWKGSSIHVWGMTRWMVPGIAATLPGTKTPTKAVTKPVTKPVAKAPKSATRGLGKAAAATAAKSATAARRAGTTARATGKATATRSTATRSPTRARR